MAAYEVLLLNTAIPQIQAAQSGDTYVVPRDIAFSTVASFAAGAEATPSIVAAGDTNTGIWFPAADTVAISTGGISRLRLDSSGNLGLGVTPSAWATLRGLQNGRANLVGYANNSEGAWLTNNAFFDGSWKYQTSSQATHYQQLSGVHSWHTAPSGTAGNAISFTQAMTLDASGNLLVGTTTSIYNTAVVQIKQTNTSSGNNGCLALQNQNASSASGVYTVAFNNSSGTLIGTISNTSTDTSYNTTSDYRLKDNQQPLTGSGAFIDALKPKTWDWKSGGKGVGFIAHEVQAVSPKTVVGEKDAVDADGKPIMQAMEYGSAEFIANIIAELQSLRARVAQLEQGA